MKALSILSIVALMSASCKPSENYKDIRTEVVTEHDKVMLDNERANANRVKLDSLLLRMDSLKMAKPNLDTVSAKKEILQVGIKLAAADFEMEKWMKEFDAELGQKTNDEAVSYFNNEKLKLKGLDSLFKDALSQSGELLRKY